MSPAGRKAASCRARQTVLAAFVVLFLAMCTRAGELSPVLFARAASSPASPAPEILVGLFRTQSVTFGCGGNWSLTTPGGEKVSLKAGSSLTLRLSGSQVAWETTGANARKGSARGNVLVAPLSPEGPFVSVVKAEGAGAAYGYTTFRGSMIVMVDGGSLLVANALDIEEYVQSVVGGEMIDSWPLEAARAQAVAVRSYAAYKTGLRKGETRRDYAGMFSSLRPEDVLIWSHDQVYRGLDEETAATMAAASSTRGEILTYQGTPAAAYYHADAGGMTEDPCYVWGKGVPYLVSVAEPPHESHHSSWTVTLTPEELSQAAGRLGVPLTEPPDVLRGLECGVSGRWFAVLLGPAQTARPVRGTDLRGILPQIKSTLFSAYAVGGNRATQGSLSPGMCFSVVGSGDVSCGVHLGSSYVIGRSDEPLPPPEAVTVLSEQRVEGSPRVVLQGSGWGHGVGLSQWGARGMALAGKDAWEILNLYYPETTPDKWW